MCSLRARDDERRRDRDGVTFRAMDDATGRATAIGFLVDYFRLPLAFLVCARVGERCEA